MTGVPVIVSDLAGSITHSIELLLIAVVLVMAAALGLVFSGRPRLLPLALALLAAALTFGALSLAGASLTMASIAVLPVLVGLAVDYAIQFQSRVQESPSRGLGDGAAGDRCARPRAGRAHDRHRRRRPARRRCSCCCSRRCRWCAASACCSSPGVAIALLCALTVGAAALVARARRGARGAALAPRALDRAAARRARARPGAARASCCAITRSPALVTRSRSARRVRRPGAVLGVGLALAALGWGLDTQTQRGDRHHQARAAEPQPRCRPATRSSATTGVGGEIDLMVGGAQPRRARHDRMDELATRARVLQRFGYSAARGLRSRAAVPGFSLPDLFSSQAAGAGAGARGRRQADRQTQVNGAARRDPAVLLPGRDHRRPARRDARVRHPPDEPRPAAEADRRDALEPAPAARASARARRPARAGGRLRRPGRLPVAAPGDAARRARARSRSCC